jgi:hypothetical protein
MVVTGGCGLLDQGDERLAFLDDIGGQLGGWPSTLRSCR